MPPMTKKSATQTTATVTYRGEGVRTYEDPNTGATYTFSPGQPVQVPPELAKRLHRDDAALWTTGEPAGGA